jgi:hypothetical protein
MAVRRWHTGGGTSAPSGYGVGANEEGRRRGAPPERGCPFIGSGVAGIGEAVVVIGAFMVAITGSEGRGGGGIKVA